MSVAGAIFAKDISRRQLVDHDQLRNQYLNLTNATLMVVQLLWLMLVLTFYCVRMPTQLMISDRAERLGSPEFKVLKYFYKLQIQLHTPNLKTYSIGTGQTI